MSDRRGAPEQPLSHRAYGTTIYWLSILAALFCVAGPFVAILLPEGNLLDPHYLFYAIWQGASPADLWAEAGDVHTGPHFWVVNLFGGDAVAQAGIVLGCASAGFAFLAAAAAYVSGKPRQPGWAALALFGAAMVFCALFGVLRAGG